MHRQRERGKRRTHRCGDDEDAPAVLRNAVVARLKNSEPSLVTQRLQSREQRSRHPSFVQREHARHVLHQHVPRLEVRDDVEERLDQ